MGNVTSTLTMRLIDGVSATAKKVKAAIEGLDKSAKGKAGRGQVGGIPIDGSFGMRGLGVTLAGYATVRGIMSAEKAYAAFDRRMTRIGITADASGAQVAAATRGVKELANEVALPVDDVVGGLDALVATGRTLQDSMSFLPAVARTAQASGAAVDDIANAANTLGLAFGITGDKMQNAFDILVTGGKLGQFELKDMASYIPTLGATVANMGWKGEKGLTKLVALLQVVRARSGSAEEAATNLRNVFQKWKSAPVEKQLRKYGVDLPKVLAKAHKEGKDEFDAFLEVIENVAKKHPDALQRIFTDQQAFLGALALLQARAKGEIDDYVDKLGNSAGAVTNDLAKVTGDAASSMERFGNAMSAAAVSAGRLADAAGLTKLLEDMTKAADDVSSSLDRISAAGKQGGTSAAADSFLDEMRFDPRARAVAKLYKQMTGLDMPVSEAVNYSSLWETTLNPWKNKVAGWEDDPEVKAAAQAAADTFFRRRFFPADPSAGGRHWPGGPEREGPGEAFGPPLPRDRPSEDEPLPPLPQARPPRAAPPSPPAAPASRPAKAVSSLPAWQRGGFGPSPPIDGPAASDRRALIPASPSDRYDLRSLWPDQLAAPFPPAGASETIIRTIDLAPQAAATMESYRGELSRQMGAIEQEVDAFRARLAAKLSFSASPRVDVTIATREVSSPISSTQTQSYRQGQKVSAMLRGGYDDIPANSGLG